MRPLAALVAIVAPALAHDLPDDPRAVQQRIEHYRARLGGPATYPAYTGLGLALLDQAAITGRPDDALEGLENSAHRSGFSELGKL